MKALGNTLGSRIINATLLGYLLLGILMVALWSPFLQSTKDFNSESRKHLEGLDQSQMTTQRAETVSRLLESHKKLDGVLAEARNRGDRLTPMVILELVVIVLLDIFLIGAFFVKPKWGTRIVLAKSIAMTLFWWMGMGAPSSASFMRFGITLFLFVAIFGWWTRSRHFLRPIS